ncbi:MAG: four helix bundle protein [Phycisphaerae bacterium]|nr:hypothetical protein [Phycisphaerales bacterium]MCK6475982.1 four helix bundle protein [Phycisphaerales bacterium]
MKAIESHRDLVAWQKAVDFGLLLYAITSRFPDHERFGLTSQLRRAGVSAASNIAEGYGRGRTNDYLRFLSMARGSLCEIDTQLAFALRLGFIDDAMYSDATMKCRECGRILAGLIRSIEETTHGQGAQH